MAPEITPVSYPNKQAAHRGNPRDECDAAPRASAFGFLHPRLLS
jgi:hypothetical protein